MAKKILLVLLFWLSISAYAKQIDSKTRVCSQILSTYLVPDWKKFKGTFSAEKIAEDNGWVRISVYMNAPNTNSNSAIGNFDVNPKRMLIFDIKDSEEHDKKVIIKHSKLDYLLKNCL